MCPGCADNRHKQWQADNKDLVLRPGDNVKMAFDTPKQKKGEHMWVEITECSEDQKTFKGTLENDPIECTEFVLGDIVVFTRDEIEQHL